MASLGHRPGVKAMRFLGGILLLSLVPGLVVADLDAGSHEGATLRFVREGSLVREISLPTLARACDVTQVEVDDPYYERKKRFLACPVRNLLLLGFGVPEEELRRESFLLRAADGFVKPASGSRLLGPGGFAAFADADLTAPGPVPAEPLWDPPWQPVWEPIDRRQVDPGPFYLVWSGVPREAAHAYPWPYQLVEIEIASLEGFYPHIAPRGVAAGSPAAEGYSVFVENCIACHAINGEGGRVGPDLNIPRSIIEYRPIDQVKAYIRNPANFRYTTMPAHDHLTSNELDALIAYFDAMKARKYDPGRASPESGSAGGGP